MMSSKGRYFGFDDILNALKAVYVDERHTFEKEFAGYVGTKYAIGTNYGRTALYLGLRAVDVLKKEVIIPAFICTVVRHAVKMAGATPRFVDINPDDFSYNLHELENAISDKTRAIVLTHFFGRVARNFEKVLDICSRKNIVLIEDCAHAIGAEYRGKRIGSLGKFSIFSLTKGMVNCGGGMLATNSAEIYHNATNILSSERASLIRRAADFPLVLSYGIEQAADKLARERIGKRGLTDALELSREIVVKMREILIGMLKRAGLVRKRGGDAQSKETRDGEERYGEGVQMERVVASIGRSQLRKVDQFNARRTAIAEKLCCVEEWYFKTQNGSSYKDVDTFAILRFTQRNALEVAKEVRQRALYLKGTWPTHQKLWEGQNTKSVKRVGKEILTYNISPDLTDREVEIIVHILNGLKY